MQVTYKRIPNSDVNEQQVFIDGELVGTIWRSWFRLGGEGWANSKRLCRSSTRAEAARELRRI